MTHYYFSNSGKLYQVYFVGKIVKVWRVNCMGELISTMREFTHTIWNEYKSELKPADKIHTITCELTTLAGF